MKSLRTLVLLVISATTLAATCEVVINGTPVGEPKVATHSDEINGYSIEFPSNWVYWDEDIEYLLLAGVQSDDVIEPNVSVKDYSLTSIPSLDEYAEQTIGVFQRLLSTMVINNSESITVDGRSAQLVDYQFDKSERVLSELRAQADLRPN